MTSGIRVRRSGASRWRFRAGDNWLGSPAGLRAQLWQRRTVRVHAHAKVEPRSKNSVTQPEEHAFLRALARGLGTRRNFRAPVVLELDLFASARNPPEIHTVAKNYLDLTYRAPVGQGRLIKDDRQVRYLAVRYFADGAFDGPSVFLRATRMTCFREDVKLARGVRLDDSHRWLDDDHRWSDDDPDLDGMLEELRDWEQNRERFGATYGKDAFELHRRHTVSRLQQRWLSDSERLLHSILLDLVSGALKTDLAEITLRGVRLPVINLEAVQRRLLFTPGISLELGLLPRRSGEGAAFRTAITNALSQLRASSPRLFPLLTQLAVIILFVPPKTDGNDLGIDLDNLARKIIPQIHSILEPPGRHPIPDPSAIEDPQLRAYFEAEAIRARRLPKHQVTRYEVIEVPRTATDPASGCVRLALCDGARGRTFSEFVNNTIEKWEDSVRG